LPSVPIDETADQAKPRDEPVDLIRVLDQYLVGARKACISKRFAVVFWHSIEQLAHPLAITIPSRRMQGAFEELFGCDPREANRNSFDKCQRIGAADLRGSSFGG
jgi:hypothetical protein